MCTLSVEFTSVFMKLSEVFKYNQFISTCVCVSLIKYLTNRCVDDLQTDYGVQWCVLLVFYFWVSENMSSYQLFLLISGSVLILVLQTCFPYRLSDCVWQQYTLQSATIFPFSYPTQNNNLLTSNTLLKNNTNDEVKETIQKSRNHKQ